jgi:hypothetical protein
MIIPSPIRLTTPPLPSPAANQTAASPQTGQTATPSKTDVQRSEESQQQLIIAAEKFSNAAKNFREARAKYEGESGIGRHLPGNQNKAEVRAAQQNLLQQISNHQFSQDPQINKQMVALWLATASDLPPKDQKVTYNQIQQKLLSSEYCQEFVEVLRSQADNPEIAKMRNAYIDTYAAQAQSFFQDQIKQQLQNGSPQDFADFLTKIDIGSKTTTQLLLERTAIANLSKDPKLADHKTTLQFALHIYDAYLEAENPRSLMNHLNALAGNSFAPLMSQLEKFSSLPPEDVKQQAQDMLDTLKAYNQMLDRCLGGKVKSMQANTKTDTIENRLQAQLFNRAANDMGQMLSQLLPTLGEIIKNPSDQSPQRELQQKLQNRIVQFAVIQARLNHIETTSDETEKGSQITNLTAGVPNDSFPYEFQQYIDQAITDKTVSDPTVFSKLIPSMGEFGKEHQATVYRDAAREALKRDDISDQMRASLEKIMLTNDLYLNRTNPAEMERIEHELLDKPFDIKTANTLAEVCNFQNLANMSSVFKLSNAYIQRYNNEYAQGFREFLQEPKNIDFLKDHMVWDQTYKPVNQPIAQLKASMGAIQASMGAIQDSLKLDELKDNKNNLQAIATAYQQVIDAKRAKPDF